MEAILSPASKKMLDIEKKLKKKSTQIQNNAQNSRTNFNIDF